MGSCLYPTTILQCNMFIFNHYCPDEESEAPNFTEHSQGGNNDLVVSEGSNLGLTTLRILIECGFKPETWVYSGSTVFLVTSSVFSGLLFIVRYNVV